MASPGDKFDLAVWHHQTGRIAHLWVVEALLFTKQPVAIWYNPAT
jgi:hypothetical protein